MAEPKTQLWHFRYRDTKMVENTLIEVAYVNGEEPTEKEARLVAEDYLAKRAEPTLKFIRVEPAIAHSSAAMLARRKAKQQD